MKWIPLILLSLFCIHCGSHKQSLYNSDAIQEKRDTAETDPYKLIFEKISAGDVEEVRLLIQEQGVEVEFRDAEGRTLLMNAVSGLKYAVVQYLLTQGADIEATDKDGKSVIEYAADDVMKALLRGEEIPKDQLNNLMMDIAIKDLNAALLLFLLNQGADPNFVKGRLSPLMALAYRATADSDMPKLLELVEILLAQPDIDVGFVSGGHTASTLAERSGKTAMVQLLNR